MTFDPQPLTGLRVAKRARWPKKFFDILETKR
jgi:hypothetical protein